MIGEMLEAAFERDPKRLAFTFARYKFVAKMLRGSKRVLEIGADSGFMARVVEQGGCEVTRTDIKGGVDYTKAHLLPAFDAVYALDVLEHVEAEDAFMSNICASLTPYGTCIIGMPSLESQRYATEQKAHVNCKTEEGLAGLMGKYFHCLYLFGMNDEALHTGFGPMTHYRLAIGNTKRVK